MRRILLLLIAVAVLLIGLSFVSMTLNLQKDEAERSSDWAETVRTAIVRVLADIENVETRQRGYLLSGQPIQIEVSQSERQSLFHMAMLKVLTSHNAIQQQNSEELGRLIAKRLSEIEKTIALSKTKGVDSAIQVVHEGEGKKTMNAIRAVVSRMAAEERKLLAERQKSIREQVGILWIALVVQAIAGLALLVLAVQSFRDYLQNEKVRTAELIAARDRAEEALAVETRFLSTVSHAVRTPMAGVIGLTELLSLEDLGTENNSTVRAIFDSSKRLLQILNDMLDASRLGASRITLEHREFPVRSLIGDVTQLILAEAQSKEIRVTGFCDEDLLEKVCGDELRVRQVLLILGFNAVKFTEKGEIRISAQLVNHDDRGTAVRFSVVDTGIGISPEEQTKLFRPFQQVQDATTSVYGGAGLGLSNSKRLVALMGGEIGVTSESGKGSTFWFEIPFLSEQCRI